MKWLLLLLCVFSLHGNAQKVLKGSVLDAQSAQPVAGASVFPSNTSIGTIADGAGHFYLSIPQGKYDLIVSSIGYETMNQTVNSSALPEGLVVRLQPKSKELETVVLEPIEKDGWEKWGLFFKESFIGTSAFAAQCTLKNPEAVRFRNSKKTNTLSAFASEPLVIENNALGYTIVYQLEDFNYNFKNGFLYYEGYPLFREMNGTPVRLRRWEKARASAYYGSMMHFMRAVFRNTLVQESFDVFALKKIPNTEKARVRSLPRHLLAQGGNNAVKREVDQDSTAYYNKVLGQADYFDVSPKVKLTGDSIAYALTSTTAGLHFKDYLIVVYTKGVAPPEFRLAYPKNGMAMMSQVTLVDQQAIEIEANGSYTPPANIMSLGYWAWFEKMATMLPFDYEVKE
jgi:hypothetical protein